MITLEGVANTIKSIERNGDSMGDLYDLTMLYDLEKKMADRMERRSQGASMSQSDAERWVAGLKNEDPARPEGAKWTQEQVRPIAQKYGVPTEGERFWEFWAVMNTMYSDYYAIAKKYNTVTPEFFADMAMAFIKDKDAVGNKVSAYYNHVVKK